MNNERHTAILLVRVSTQRQDFDEQERELFDLAISDGFSESDIVIISEKESGIKLAEDQRRGLNRMKEVINEGGVKCVYAWEPSRIARKKKILFSITDYLIERGIQLVIKEPYIRLLNQDGSINDGAETILTLFGQLAESEMRNKQARWSRTRKANSKAGIWQGGKSIRYGYTIDNENRYIINDEEASIIRLCYDLYTTTDMGQTHLRNELIRRGIELSQDRIRRLLSFEGYTGKPVRHKYWGDREKFGNEIVYPAIISEELFLLAQSKKKNANHTAYKGQNYYLGRGLLRCPQCGHLYLGYKTLGQYKCLANKHDNKDIKKCSNRVSININVLDTLIWDATVSEYIKERASTNADNRANYQKQIDICNQVIESAKKRIEKVLQKRKRYALIYANGDIDDNVYEQHRYAVEEELMSIQKDVTASKEKIEQLKKLIESSDNPSYVDIIKNLSEDAFGIKELREMCELVHTYISDIALSENDWLGSNTKSITITSVTGTKYEYLSRYSYGDGHCHKYYCKRDQLSKYIGPWYEIHPDVIIRRKLGRGNSGYRDVEIIRNEGEYYGKDVQIRSNEDPRAAICKMIDLANSKNTKSI